MPPLLADVAALTVGNEGASGAVGYTYAIVGIDANGQRSLAEAGATATGNAVLDGTNFNRLTWSDIAGYVSYEIFRTISAGDPATLGLIGTALFGAEVFDDTGLAPTAGTAGTESTANATGEGAAMELKTVNGDVNVATETFGVGTYQIQGSFSGSGGFVNEGTALSAAATVLVVTKKYIRLRSKCTAFTSGTPSGFVCGDDH